uniref:Tributyrin esterase n=1 Tax=Ganoderma boninense TaxID=34458 RepID=A0A5K1K308_9APHY|nr:Tributyrin esterase [Ganoderma boninense]
MLVPPQPPDTPSLTPLSRLPISGTDASLLPQDGHPLPSGDDFVTLFLATPNELLFPSASLPACPPLGEPFVSDAVDPSQDPSAETQMLIPAPSSSSNSKRVKKPKNRLKSRKPSSVVTSRVPPSKSLQRNRAELVKGTSVSYGDGCRLDCATLLGNALHFADYDVVALPGQTFGQKVSFWFDNEILKGNGPFTCQQNVLLRGGQPTKRRLAEVTARFMECFIKYSKERRQPFPFSLEHLVLLRIDVISRSAVRPVFDFVMPTGHPGGAS